MKGNPNEEMSQICGMLGVTLPQSSDLTYHPIHLSYNICSSHKYKSPTSKQGIINHNHITTSYIYTHISFATPSPFSTILLLANLSFCRPITMCKNQHLTTSKPHKSVYPVLTQQIRIRREQLTITTSRPIPK
jgi:hypothetical protein